MKLDGWTRIALIAFGSLIFSLGLGPLFMAGIDDIADIDDSRIMLTSIVIIVMTLGVAALCLVACQRDARWAKQQTQGVRLPVVLIVSAVVACISILVASTDHENNTAWRYADKLDPGPGVSSVRLREFGRFFARLELSNSPQFNGSLAAIPVTWPMWFGGGESAVLLRIPVNDVLGQPSKCRDELLVSLTSGGSDASLFRAEIAGSELCGQWQRLDFEAASGVTELLLQIEDGAFPETSGLDVMLVRHRPNAQWLWRTGTVLALTVILAILATISITARDYDRPGKRKVPVPSIRIPFACAALLLFVVLGNVFVYSYVSQEKTIYTWDFAGYWTSARNVSEFLQGADRKSASKMVALPEAANSQPRSREPGQSMPDPRAVAALIRNLRFAEYNISPNLAIAPVLVAFGGSRVVYELSLLNVYALAAVIMLLAALRTVVTTGSARAVAWWPIIPVVCVFCLIPFWVPIVRGYIGISVVAINFAVLWLYFRRPLEKIDLPALLLIGILLFAGVVMQRWNAYWVVAFCVVLAVDGARSLLQSGSFSVNTVLRAFRVPIVAGSSAFFLFAALAWPKLVTTITTDYADIYSAFLEDDGFADALVRLINAFGGGLVAIVAVAFLYLAYEKTTRRVALLLGLQLTVAFFHFSSTQTFGPHHIYILMPGLLIVLSLGLIRALSTTRRSVRIAGIGGLVLVVISGYASGMAVFAPTGPPHLLPESIRLLSQSYRPPLIRNDLDEFVRMTAYIDENLGEGERFYVAAGSQTLNAAHFRTVGISTGIEFESEELGLPSAVIDKRDGFPSQILRAQLVITTTPIQFSRSPNDQHVVRIPTESLLEADGIGRAFERLPETFRLDGDVEVLIFRRTRPNTPDEVMDMSDKLRVLYPDRPDVYE